MPQAGVEIRHYHIAAGRLDDALRAFIRTSGVQLLYSPELTATRRSAPLDGDFLPEQALDILLQGSGLQAEEVAQQTYVLRSAAHPIAPAKAPSPSYRTSRSSSDPPTWYRWK